MLNTPTTSTTPQDSASTATATAPVPLMMYQQQQLAVGSGGGGGGGGSGIHQPPQMQTNWLPVGFSLEEESANNAATTTAVGSTTTTNNNGVPGQNNNINSSSNSTQLSNSSNNYNNSNNNSTNIYAAAAAATTSSQQQNVVTLGSGTTMMQPLPDTTVLAPGPGVGHVVRTSSMMTADSSNQGSVFKEGGRITPQAAPGGVFDTDQSSVDFEGGGGGGPSQSPVGIGNQSPGGATAPAMGTLTTTTTTAGGGAGTELDLSNLYVSGIPDHWSEKMIEEVFTKYGPVSSAKLMLDIHTGQSRGFAFVMFEIQEDASRALVDVPAKHPGITIKYAKKESAATLGTPTKKLFIRNLPKMITRELLKQTIEQKLKEEREKSSSSAPSPQEDLVKRITIRADPVGNGHQGGVGGGMQPVGDLMVAHVVTDSAESATLIAKILHVTTPWPDLCSTPLLAKVVTSKSAKASKVRQQQQMRESQSTSPQSVLSGQFDPANTIPSSMTSPYSAAPGISPPLIGGRVTPQAQQQQLAGYQTPGTATPPSPGVPFRSPQQPAGIVMGGGGVGAGAGGGYLQQGIPSGPGGVAGVPFVAAGQPVTQTSQQHQPMVMMTMAQAQQLLQQQQQHQPQQPGAFVQPAPQPLVFQPNIVAPQGCVPVAQFPQQQMVGVPGIPAPQQPQQLQPQFAPIPLVAQPQQLQPPPANLPLQQTSPTTSSPGLFNLQSK